MLITNNTRCTVAAVVQASSTNQSSPITSTKLTKNLRAKVLNVNFCEPSSRIAHGCRRPHERRALSAYSECCHAHSRDDGVKVTGRTPACKRRQ